MYKKTADVGKTVFNLEIPKENCDLYSNFSGKTLFRINFLRKNRSASGKTIILLSYQEICCEKKCVQCNHNFGMWAPSHRFSAAFSWLSCSFVSSQTLGGGRHQSFCRFPNNLSTFWFSSRSSPLPSIHSAVLSIRVLSSFLGLMNND